MHPLLLFFFFFFFFFLLLLPSLHSTATNTCPYDMTSASRIIPPDCYANATSTSPSPSPSSVRPLPTTARSTTCCWFVFASYLYVAIRYANSTGIAFLTDPAATRCTSNFTTYLLRQGLASPSLLLSDQRCNLQGDPVKFVSGELPCEYSTVSAILSDTNLTASRRLCNKGPEYLLAVNQSACASCQDAVTNAVFGLLHVTRSNEVVSCGMAATMGLWAPILPAPQRFRSFALCVLQILENVGNLRTGNLFPSASTPPTAAANNGGSSNSVGSLSCLSSKIIEATSASAGLIVILSVALLFVYVGRKRRRRKWRSTAVDGDHGDDEHTADVIRSPLPTEGLYIFTKSELKQATNNYDPKLLIGEGGAGKVYLGKLPSGQNVAIKRISKKKKLGEFYREVEVLAKLRHRNLTTLLGYCCLQEKEHVLVYEYMSGGNLSKALYHGIISWHHRVKIAVDVAEGLTYLHEFQDGMVVHRDVKPSNVLLTESGQAKLSDFGVSKIVPAEISHVSTEVKGTRGYVDPEYFFAGQVSESTDVYSFGIVLLELVTGMKAVVPTPSGGAESIVHTAHAVMTAAVAASGEEAEPDAGRVVDERLGTEWDQATVTEVFKVAYRCVKPYKNERPRMMEVLVVLKRALAELDAKVEMDGQDEDLNEDGACDGCTASFTSPSVRGFSW